MTVVHDDCPYGMEEFCELTYPCKECHKQENVWAEKWVKKFGNN